MSILECPRASRLSRPSITGLSYPDANIRLYPGIPHTDGEAMSDCNQMTLISCETNPLTAVVGGLCSEQDLARAAWSIIRNGELAELSEPESELVHALEESDSAGGDSRLIDLIRSGQDPLGDALMHLRPPDQRRPLGATYTPSEIVSSIVAWVAERSRPTRVVDPGTGSARFLLEAGRVLPEALLVGVEIDALAALLARANLTAAGFDHRARILVRDYRDAYLGESDGTTAYIGNPPYVRHHQIEPRWKKWLATNSASLGLKASGLAGLHVHFMLATALHARPGDVGAFVTSSEWLDVNYGHLPRMLVATQLGGVSIHLVDPHATPFGNAATTAAVTCFQVGERSASLRMERVPSISDLGVLNGGQRFSRRRLRAASRWSPLLNGSQKPPEGYVELGEICRVHRGAVTGANSTWITDADDPALPPEVLFPSVTRAIELLSAADGVLSSTRGLRAVIDLPADLDMFDKADRLHINRFLRSAERRGVRSGYIARNRNPWWTVGLRCPAPILATYMARRPPAFVRNLAGAHNINAVHGIYPREPMSAATLDALAVALRDAAPTAVGRIYAGGLLKFEPSEMARICVPSPTMLEAIAT